MSSPEGWLYFANNVLPDVITGGAQVETEPGSNLGPAVGPEGGAFAPLPNLVMDLQAIGAGMGLTIPQSVLDQVANPPPPPAPTVDIPASPAGDPNQSAKDVISSELNAWGLGSLTDWAWNLVSSGASHDQIMFELRKTDAYKQRFAGMALRAANGHNPISEAEYLSLEDTYGQIARGAGLLPGSYDPVKAIGNDVSAKEFSERATMGARALFDEDAQTQQVLTEWFGLNPGQIASWYLNPDNAVPKLQQMLYTGEIGGAARGLGIDLSQGVAAAVAQAGFTGQSARAGLAQVAQQSPLYDESITDTQNLTSEQAVQAQFGLSAAATQAVQARAARRAAAGQGGGGSVVTNEGVLASRTAR